MLFSIILPIYNVEKYLKECVDSILSQTFSEFEIILVDDGSNDKSPLICDEYEKKDSRIRVIHKPNGGQSSARNAGTKAALGDYIIYIDSDDFVMDNFFLEKLSGKIGKDIIFYKHQKYFDRTKNIQPCTYSYGMIDKYDSLPVIIKKMVESDSFYGMAWNKCIKRNLIIKNNIMFEEGLLGEDMEWIYHLIIHATSIDVIDESFIAYRQRENSITSSIKLKNLTDFVYILEKWYAGVSKSSLPKDEKIALYGSLAKYYSNLLITYTRVKDAEKKKYDMRIKKLSKLLDYSMSSRPKKIAKMYRFFGYRITVTALQILDRVK